MTDTQHRKAATDFAAYWAGKGYEKGESQKYWLMLLRDVLGVSEPEKYIVFEEKILLDHTSFIDARIPSTSVLIEQKSLGKDLTAPLKQSDGTMLTPFGQAKRYADTLPYSLRPRWIVVSNFSEIHIYDMEHPKDDAEVVLLKDLHSEWPRLMFLVDNRVEAVRRQTDVSIEAGKIVGLLYEALRKTYLNPDSQETLKELNKLCVRIVFCLYAEDTDLFGRRNAFHDYLAPYRNNPADFRRALIDLFSLLDTRPEERDPYISAPLSEFPYVNGNLFSGKVTIPSLSTEFINLLLDKASLGFDWSGISPTIFGAVFESTLNPLTRRSGGMHYTSIDNIHRVIDPLFLNSLREKLDRARNEPNQSTRRKRLLEFREHLASLIFLDPACGSGNFLTETYISIRRLENEALRAEKRYIEFNFGEDFSPIKVSIRQFYGIEINDFAVAVAQTALWIAENQMMKETSDIVGVELNFLPLKSYHHIVEGNALTLDWNDIIDKSKLSYILGNPPFIGGMMMTPGQHEEMVLVWGKTKGVGELDYVSAWYKKAFDYIADTAITCAFVSTNSICQGQQAATMWKPLEGLTRIFACKTFIWDSESRDKAHVHCVIIGFTRGQWSGTKCIYDNDSVHEASNINCYLMDAPDIYVESRSTPLCDVPRMAFGSMPRDGGNLILSDTDRSEFIHKEPAAAKWIRRYVGADEFINSKSRWCLWLVGASPKEMHSSHLLMDRIERVRQFRLASKAAATRKFAGTPALFCQIAQPDTDYIIIPGVSSERRRYLPMGFMDKVVIASNLVQIIPAATLYHFGVLTSAVHMAWMRRVAGRLKSDYRYSKDIVYNNFPWPEPTVKHRQAIENAAAKILEARSLYPDCSLADLYDDRIMPPELSRAHRECDKAVMNAYGFPASLTEDEIVDRLMTLFEKLILS